MVGYLIRGQLISLRIKTDGALPLLSILSLVSSAPSSRHVHGLTLTTHPFLSGIPSAGSQGFSVDPVSS